MVSSGDRGDRGDRDGLVILVNNIDVGLVVVGPEGSSILVAGVVETEDHAVRGDRTDLVAGRSTIEGRAEGVGVLHVGEAGDDVVLVLDDIVSGNEHLVGVVVETGGGDGGIDLNGGLLAVNDGGQDIVGAGGIGDDVGIGLLDKVGVNIGDTGEVDRGDVNDLDLVGVVVAGLTAKPVMPAVVSMLGILA